MGEVGWEEKGTEVDWLCGSYYAIIGLYQIYV